jgi:hypothetical protein
VHLHLVNSEILARQEIVWDGATSEHDRVLDLTRVTVPSPNGDGTYLVPQPVVQHNGAEGVGFRPESIQRDESIVPATGVEKGAQGHGHSLSGRGGAHQGDL